MSEEGFPAFDIDTEKDNEAFKPKPGIHARQLGGDKLVTCKVGGFKRCKLPFKTTSGLGNHMRQIHQPKIGDVYNNDIIRIAYKTSTIPIYDTKCKGFVFPDEIRFPEGYQLEKIMKGFMLIKDQATGRQYEGIQMILVKEGKK